MTVICVIDGKKNMYNNDFDRVICHLNVPKKQKLDCFEKKVWKTWGNCTVIFLKHTYPDNIIT